MPTPQELETKFWDALRSDRTMMLGLHGAEEGHTRPMTAQLEGGDHGPIWFFADKDSELVQATAHHANAIAAFVSKEHDLFAAIHGTLSLDSDRATIDRLWNRYVGAWFEGGKDDPRVALLRLDPDRAEIWLDGSSLVAGVRLLFGADPKEEYKDNVATVVLR